VSYNRRVKVRAWPLVLAVGSLAGCGEPPAARSPNAVLAKMEERRPDGVFVEVPHATPAAVERTPLRGTIALREPVARAQVVELITKFFRAFEDEDSEGFAGLVTEDVIALDGGTAASRLFDVWRARMRAASFQVLRGQSYIRFEEMDRYDATQDEERAREAPSSLRGFVQLVRPGEVLVHVPVAPPKTGDTFFGTAFDFMLRRTRDGLKIAGLNEENPP
jgi:hypothetical protein